jgi:uridine phosphorylase
MQIPDSELILNPDGSIYHLNLRPEHIADTVIVVGDPERVPKVSKYLDAIEFKLHKREFVTHTGNLGKRRITVISSGIGTDNVEILLNELDALVNVDFKEREWRGWEKHRSLDIIRIGTSGSLQAAIEVDTVLASESTIGLDTLMCFYDIDQSSIENQITTSLQEKLNLPFQPYCIHLPTSEYQGSLNLLNKLTATDEVLRGTTITCPGFYAPQGRKIRLNPKNPDFISILQNFKSLHLPNGLTNFEMETAGYYALCRMLGHSMVSMNAILANRITNKFSSNPEKVVDTLIKKVLDKLSNESP